MKEMLQKPCPRVLRWNLPSSDGQPHIGTMSHAVDGKIDTINVQGFRVLGRVGRQSLMILEFIVNEIEERLAHLTPLRVKPDLIQFTFDHLMIQFPPEMDENWVRYVLVNLGQILCDQTGRELLSCAYTTQLLHSTVEVCWNNNDSYFIWFNLCVESPDR